MELSIVLVILGLLTGGILAGQSLIRASELRGITRQINNYRVASAAFRDKYFMLPGDMTNATAFWGTASGGCPSGARSGTQTCNGTGDGKVGNNGNGNGFTERYESYLFWQHLANAGLLEGNYTGIGNPYVYGTNAPAYYGSTGAGYSIYHLGTHTDGGYYQANYGNLLYLGSAYASDLTYPAIRPLLRPEDQWNLDTKMDDGLPASGTMLSMKSQHNASCTTSDTDAAALYNLANNGRNCSILYRTGL